MPFRRVSILKMTIRYTSNGSEQYTVNNRDFVSGVLGEKEKASRTVLVRVDKDDRKLLYHHLLRVFGKRPSEVFNFANGKITYSLLEMNNRRHANLLVKMAGERYSSADLAQSVQASTSNSSECANQTLPYSSRILYVDKQTLTEAYSKADDVVLEDIANFDAIQRRSIGTDLKLCNSTDDQLKSLSEQNNLSEVNKRLRFFLCSIIEDSLAGVLGSAKIYPFGSTINGFGTNDSDLDCCLLFNDSYEEPRTAERSHLNNEERRVFGFLNAKDFGSERRCLQQLLTDIAEHLQRFCPWCTQTLAITHAKVPIVKFKTCVARFPCDLSITDRKTLLMSELLWHCLQVDERVRWLLFAIRYWANSIGVCSNQVGFKSFHFMALLIFFLQSRTDPLLPPLSQFAQSSGFAHALSLPELLTSLDKNSTSMLDACKDNWNNVSSSSRCREGFCITSGQRLENLTNGRLFAPYPFERDSNILRAVGAQAGMSMRTMLGPTLRLMDSKVFQGPSGNQKWGILCFTDKRYLNRSKTDASPPGDSQLLDALADAGFGKKAKARRT